MGQTEHFLQQLADQVKDVDSREEARKSAAADSNIQFLWSYAASFEPESLNHFELWDLLANEEAWKDESKIKANLLSNGSLKINIEPNA